MAISSSFLAVQNATAEALPSVVQVKPDIHFSGPNCNIMTITLEKTTTYSDPSNSQPDRVRKRKMRKIFTINCDTPEQIDIEIKEGITTGITTNPPSTPSTLLTIFKINVNPSLRGADVNPLNPSQFIVRQRPHPNTITNTNVRNPLTFISNSTGINNEANSIVTTRPSSPYEAYRLPILNFNQSRFELYAPSFSPNPLSTINTLLAERNKNNTAWINVTISSLFRDLLEEVPTNFLKLIIVGNHQIVDSSGTPVLTATRIRDTTTPFPFAITGFTINSIEDIEARWNQFMLGRASEFRDYIFNSITIGLNIEILPAQKINEGPTPKTYNSTFRVFTLNNSDDFIDGQYESSISNRFRDLNTGNVNIPRLDSLNLRRGTFPNGGIFIWDSLCPGRLQITGVKFLSGSSNVYPSLTGDPTQDRVIQAIRDNNRVAFDEIRRFLSLKNNDRITTNLNTVLLRIEGHTDTVGSSSSNQTLSQSRAQSVKTELENPTPLIPWPVGVTQPISSAVFDSTVGFGETRLKVFTPDNTENQENRRVEFRIVNITC